MTRDEDDDPTPLPSWLPEPLHASTQRPRPTVYHRSLGYPIAAVGALGVLMGIFLRGATIEWIFGAGLLVIGTRIVLGHSAQSR